MCTQVINGNSICCDKCNRWYHSKCTNLKKYEFQTHLKNKYKNWKCESCINKYCNNVTKLSQILIVYVVKNVTDGFCF